jgi:hypothetical protein
MEAYREYIKCKEALLKHQNVKTEIGHFMEDRGFEFDEFHKSLFSQKDKNTVQGFFRHFKDDDNTYLAKQGVPYIHKCLQQILNNNLQKTHTLICSGQKSSEYSTQALTRYQNIIDCVGLPWKIDEETYTILTEPETLLDEYFQSLKTENVKLIVPNNDLILALDELRLGSVEGCFSATRRYTIALKEHLGKVEVQDYQLPFQNGNFKKLTTELFGLLSGAVKNQKPQNGWTLEEARFLLRMAITLHTYYEKIDSKIATQKKQFEEPLF